MRNDRVAAVPLLLALVACGDAAGRNYAPPVQSLSGTILAGDVPPPATVRIAVVWKHSDPAGKVLHVVQELAVRAEFPARFHVDLSAPPPLEALNDGPSADGGPAPFRYSRGTLLVYDDRDGNGALELAPLDVPTSPDRILGAPDRLSIYYLEGTPSADLLALGVHPGFNLWREPLFIDPQPGAHDCKRVASGPVEILPLDTDIRIALTATPDLARLICDEHPSKVPEPGPLAKYTVREVTCNASGYLIKWCTSQEGLCSQSWCYFECGPGPPPPPSTCPAP